MKRKIEWTTSRGQAVVEVALATTKTINADGDSVTVPACEMSITATVAGQVVGFGHPIAKAMTVQGVEIAGTIGKLAVRPEHMAQILAAISEVEATPEWQAKVAAQEANRKSAAERAESDRRMGVCPRCGTICHGDCRA